MPTNKQIRAKFKLVDTLADQEIELIKAYQEISNLIKEEKYAYASGRLSYLLGISTELAHHAEMLVTQQFKRIFDVRPEITHSFDEINEKKDKVLEWADEIKDAAIELQKLLHATIGGTKDRTQVLNSSMQLHEKFVLDQRLMEFLSLSRNIFLEYSIYEQRELSYKNEVQDIYKRLKLHPRICKVSEKLFENRHYRNAILDSFIEIEKMTREKSGINQTGRRLYGIVFNPEHPILRLNPLETTNDIDEQKGFMHILIGAGMGIRNPKAHDTFIQTDPYRTLEYLCLASLLAKRIDESKKISHIGLKKVIV